MHGKFKDLIRFFNLLLFCAFLSLSCANTANARFLTPDTWDPILAGVDFNRYAYGGNDPVNNSDANGHYMEGKDGDHLQSMSDNDRENYHLESKIVNGVAEKFNNHPDKPAHISNMSTNDVRQNLRQSTAVGNEQFNRHLEYGSLAIGGVGTIRLGVIGVKAGIAAVRSGPALAKDATAALAKKVHSVLDPIAQKQRATAVLSTDKATLVGSGVRDLSPTQKTLATQLGLQPTKKAGAHAEVTVIDAAKKIGAKPSSLSVAGQKICSSCATRITESGGRLIDDSTAIWP